MNKKTHEKITNFQKYFMNFFWTRPDPTHLFWANSGALSTIHVNSGE
jgi:hypothetical protein